MIQYIQHRHTQAIRIRHSETCDAPVNSDEVLLLETPGDIESVAWHHARLCQGAYAHPWLKPTTELLLHIISEARGDAFCQAVRISRGEKKGS